MEGGLIVLWMGRITARFKKREFRRNIRAGVGSKPIDTYRDVLLCFILVGNIGLKRINSRNRVNGITRVMFVILLMVCTEKQCAVNNVNSD